MSSALPNVIAALLTNLKAAQSLAGVRVFDGPEIDESYPGDAIAVGHDGNFEADEINAGDVAQEYGPLGAHRKYEDGTVNCVLWTWDGATDLTARRLRAAELVSAVEAVILADVSLGGVCLFAGFATSRLGYRQTNAGAAVTARFTVTYRAYI